MSPRPTKRTRKPLKASLRGSLSLFSGLPAWQKAALLAGFFVILAGTSLFVYAYVHFSNLIDQRMNGDVFSNASMVFAAPTPVEVGEPLTAAEAVAHLRRAQYSPGRTPKGFGCYELQGQRLSIYPGPASYFVTGPEHEGPVVIEFQDGKVASITPLDHPASLQTYDLEPDEITTLFDQNRSKRRVVGYDELPKDLVEAVLAAEDRRFFEHHGVDYYRMIAAALHDVRLDERAQGGSTLTMQLVRAPGMFVSRKRTFRRKLQEVFIASLLEQRFTKQQIFELYANDVYLGQRGSFSIYGFGEAADGYFGKDVRSLNLAQAALLAGLIRGPNFYSPYKYPVRAKERRDWVLRRMVADDFITEETASKTAAMPLGVAPQNIEGSQAPYFVDMLKDQLLSQYPERDLVGESYRIYTTIDPDLQRAASDSVRVGMEEVDKLLDKRKLRKGDRARDPNQPQVALVVLDPRTGEIKALVGGRNYGVSQLNHVLARRQPGSSFKPFVYATALSTGIGPEQPVITPVTLLNDEPTTFVYGDKTYDPNNYKQEYRGQVTVREALTHSLNVATVQLAQMVGYERIRDLAMAAGINRDLRATPAIALGSYVATPLEIAGAYTIFADQGEYQQPTSILRVDDASGHTLPSSPHLSRQVLDPRVAYLMDSLMESVINNGTGAGVRSRGFGLPAAGKTGTSHDAWFAGFTSNLLAVVWVGYDDDRDVRLSGAQAALPVWAEFMKRATTLPAYRDVHEFTPPPGIVEAQVPAFSDNPGDATTRTEYFIDGTQPSALSPLQGMANGVTSLFHRIFGGGSAIPAAAPAAPPSSNPPAMAAHPAPGGQAAGLPPGVSANRSPKKKGPLKKLFSIFKGHPKGQSQQPPEPQPDPQ